MRKRWRRLLVNPGDASPPPTRWGVWAIAALAVGGFFLWFFLRSSGPDTGVGERPTASEDAVRFVLTAGSFTQGTRLFNVLDGASIDPHLSQAIVQTLSKLLDPRSLNESDRYEVRHSTSGDFRSLLVTRKLERFVVEPSQGDEPRTFSARKEAVPLTRSEKTASGTLTDSLWASMRGQGLDPVVIVELADIFAWDIDFLTETRVGDRFALTWEEERTPENRLASLKILGAIYNGKFTGRHTATRFMDDYYAHDGASLRRSFLHAPLNFRRISSGFTSRRFHPILRKYRAHHGTDYAAPKGTPVVTVGDGTVYFRGYAGGLGNVVKVRHNGTYSSYYGHLSRFAKNVSAGTRVKQGQVIGYVGSTGLSTGPHLHFEMIKNGTSINFLKLKVPSVGGVPSAHLPAFEQQRNKILPSLEKRLPPTPERKI
ncbi:MAG: M23 family metallopeptidase [Elusimicrobia bacterium]|nr:M23 family metallopeptidase [Elusimicrobiota bacterium]MBP9699506.1 M23 family metallopeptidase [Elusimicrobiota bacterium]